MVNPTHPDFSFDTYPGLDADLTAAYERNVTLGTAEPSEEIAGAGLAAVVQSELSKGNPRELAEEISVWATSKLNDALTTWRNYDIGDIGRVPVNVQLLASTNPNFAITMTRLHETNNRLGSAMTPEQNPEGIRIGDTLGLTLIPWQAMRDNLGDFKEWLETMRENQGLASNTNDYMNENLLNAIQDNKPFYRDPAEPFRLLTATEYLDKKIAQDGPWGVFLAQTSEQAGVESIKGQSPDQMTDNGAGHLVIQEQVVDGMGIFEWLALTLQEDPTNLSAADYSWLLANRLVLDNGEVQVPFGDFYGGRVKSILNDAGYDIDGARVRLAVM